MATQSKAQFLNDVHAFLKKRYKPKAERVAPRLTVLEAVEYGICHEDSSREQANQALSRFKDGFFDWNEVRVSSLEEIQGALAGMSDAEGRAYRIRRFLRQLFEKTYGFSLEVLAKKPLKESLKLLQEYEALTSDYVSATVVQQALGGHAIPVDGSTRRALERLGVADAETDLPSLRAILERAVPKNRGVEFADLLEELAHDTCVEGIPDCPRCELRKICPTARTRKDEPHPPKPVAAKAGAAAKDVVTDGVKAPKSRPAKAAKAVLPPPPTPPTPPPAKPTKGKSRGGK
jgi:endonuclease III